MKIQQLIMLGNQRLANLFKIVFLILASSLVLMPKQAISAQLQGLDYSSLPGAKTQIVLTFSEAIDGPNSFSIDEPARIVLDFAGVANQLNKKTQDINIGVTKSVSTVEAGNRTRMVVNLAQKAAYVVEHTDNIVKLTISGSSQTIAKRSGGSEVVDIDFESQKISMIKNKENNYDYLILAHGAIINDFNIPGLKEHAFVLKDQYQAKKIFQELKQLKPN